jgi:endogenous inhibitor of DNA gyrase (YacG/DUF329 family)
MAPAPRVWCAYCRRVQVSPAWRPFCSERCKLLDLASWVDEGYRIPGETVTLDTDPDHPQSSES